MPNERLSMRHIREVLRLHYSLGMSQRTVARSLGLAQGTVSKYINRSRRAGLSWPLPPELDDEVRLENRLYPPPPDLPSEQRPQPDWAVAHSDLRRPGVTLMLLWEEYCDTTANAFSYSWFCECYKEWSGRLKPTLRQVHVAGEKLFVDYSGHTMEVIDRLIGEVHTAQIFVAVLGASNFTYAEASFTQSLPDWIGSHVRAFHFFGGAARQTVRTISRPASPGPVFTSRWSTAPIATSPAIIEPPFCRPGPIAPGTRRALHIASCVDDGAGINLGRLGRYRPPTPLTSVAPLSGAYKQRSSLP